MILVCGESADPVVGLLCRQLHEHDYSYLLLDLAAHPKDFRVFWTWNGRYPDGYIASPSWKLNLEDLTSVFVRYSPMDERMRPPHTDSKKRSVKRAEWDAALVTLLDCLPCLVVNRPGSSLSTRSKLFQALHIRSCGLLTPRTLVATDPEAALQFYEECGRQVIFKSVSRVPSVVCMMEDEDLERLPLLRHGPTQFQEFVPGTNIRVHTIGESWIATRIHSNTVDYRYPGPHQQSVEMEPMTLPCDIAAGCVRLARQLNLAFTGIDLKETPTGNYYCFEVNSSPVFDHYELKSGQSIGAFLANFLQNHRS
jgi:glutathione synthase/RimK-type ligase-like ATP-grasp enzyme